MEKMAMEKIMEEILELTKEKLVNSFNQKGENTTTRLMFPPERQKEDRPRVSEQELRFAFVEAFNEICERKKLPWRYAVEVPTNDTYCFKGEPCVSKNGQSAMFDMVIFDEENNRRILIEFKGNNPQTKLYEKDFVKLTNPAEYPEDNQCLSYFIQLLRSSDNKTLKSLNKKCSTQRNRIHFKFLNLSESKYLDLNEIFK
ncbi:MAG: hypothetical protein K2G23_04365 [Muribaculaceae bacterium]|nr:hypothetical protein [Muribaculaceae bacterium]